MNKCNCPDPFCEHDYEQCPEEATESTDLGLMCKRCHSEYTREQRRLERIKAKGTRPVTCPDCGTVHQLSIALEEAMIVTEIDVIANCAVCDSVEYNGEAPQEGK